MKKVNIISSIKSDNRDLLESGYVLKDPFNEIIDRFDNQKIIIVGPSSSGKSLFGQYYVNILGQSYSNGIYYPMRKVGEDVIYTLNVSKKKLEHYAEMKMIKYLCTMVKQSDYTLYNSDFKQIDEENREDIKRLISNINKEKAIGTFLTFGQYTRGLVDGIKRKMQIGSLEIIFDMLDSHNQLIQETMKKYFTLFDRSIVLTQDKEVSIDDYKRQYLLDEKYSIIDLEYCYDLEILRSIVNKRLMKIQMETGALLGYDDIYQIINSSIFENQVAAAKGDISAIVHGVYYALDYIVNEGRNPLTKAVDYKFGYNSDRCIEMENKKQISNPARVLKL